MSKSADSKKKLHWSALVALTAFLTFAGSAIAVGDQLQSDADVMSGGLNATVTNCSIAHTFEGQARIAFSGSQHFASGATVTIGYVSPNPKITVTAGTLLLPNPWTNGSSDATRSISVHVQSGIGNATYKIDGTASGARAGGGMLSITDSFNINVSCPANTAPTLILPGDVTVDAEGPGGTSVSYTVFATDAEDDPDPTPSCSPPSASVFPLGATTVNCSVTDSNGTTTTGSFAIVVRDTTGPVLSLPSDMTVEATGPDGAAVAFSASGSDAVDGDLSATCDVDSNATFPLGSTTVNCFATDSAGNTTSGSFAITVVDTTAPNLSVAGDVVTEADGPAGSVVTFSVSASDLVDGALTVSCSPASESTFPLGDTTVNCSATDSAGNTAHGSFTVTVQDTTPPSLTLPSDITEEATGPGGAAVTFTTSANDLVDGAVGVNCSHDSASTFPLGSTTVQCSATDNAGNMANGSFTIVVEDTTPPTIDPNDDVTLDASSVSGTSVHYASPATHDAVDGDGVATCAPVSGSIFSLGTTTVTCTATDAAGNVATPTTFKVSVLLRLSGFYRPVDTNGVWNTVKGGSTVPFAFEVFAGSTELSDASVVDMFHVKGVACPLTGVTTDDIELTTTGSTLLRYDDVAGQFVQNWQTPKKPGVCYHVTMLTDDGSSISANFKLK